MTVQTEPILEERVEDALVNILERIGFDRIHSRNATVSSVQFEGVDHGWENYIPGIHTYTYYAFNGVLVIAEKLSAKRYRVVEMTGGKKKKKEEKKNLK